MGSLCMSCASIIIHGKDRCFVLKENIVEGRSSYVPMALWTASELAKEHNRRTASRPREEERSMILVRIPSKRNWSAVII
jgi:hypothetical protein